MQGIYKWDGWAACASRLVLLLIAAGLLQVEPEGEPGNVSSKVTFIFSLLCSLEDKELYQKLFTQ